MPASTHACDRLGHVTKSVGVHEAKTHLSRLIEEVAAGEEVVITRRGEAVASLGPPPRDVPLQFGIDHGRFVVPADFDAPLPDELLAAFER
jgi:antitoxin (DNA-binding transcriptional repressor) of toxin-antitoxin stability system